MYNTDMQPSWDLYILLILFIGLVYGMLIDKKRVLSVLVNFYIALAVTLVGGDAFYRVVSNFKIISNSLVSSVFGTKTILLVLVALILTVKSEMSGLENSTLSRFQGGVYGLLLATFILAAVFSFMSSPEIVSLNSNYAFLIARYRAALVGLPVVVMVLGSFLSPPPKKKKKK